LIVAQLIPVTDQQVRMMLMTFSRSWVQRSMSQTTFS